MEQGPIRLNAAVFVYSDELSAVTDLTRE